MSSRIAILEGYDAAPSSFRRYGEPERSEVEKCVIRCYEQRSETMAAKRKTKRTGRRSKAQVKAAKAAGKRMRRAVRACKGKTGATRKKCMSKNLRKK